MRITRDEMRVTKSDVVDWRMAAKEFAERIRAHIRSGEPAVSTDYQPKRLPDSVLTGRIQAIFDTEINPAIAAHGGVVSLLDVQNCHVFIKMGSRWQGGRRGEVTRRETCECNGPCAGRVRKGRSGTASSRSAPNGWRTLAGVTKIRLAVHLTS